jgi:hypothetical protein
VKSCSSQPEKDRANKKTKHFCLNPAPPHAPILNPRCNRSLNKFYIRFSQSKPHGTLNFTVLTDPTCFFFSFNTCHDMTGWDIRCMNLWFYASVSHVSSWQFINWGDMLIFQRCHRLLLPKSLTIVLLFLVLSFKLEKKIVCNPKNGLGEVRGDLGK